MRLALVFTITTCMCLVCSVIEADTPSVVADEEGRRTGVGQLALAEPATTHRRRPNLLLIVSDNQGYGDLGCFGNPEILTPHIDALAAGGVRLTHFYIAWPACTPSRGAILTGRYPQRNGLYGMIRNNMVNYGHQYTEIEYAFTPEMTLGLDLREVTIAQALKAGGYATGMVGKWDSGRARRFLPLQRGFDFFYGFACTGIDFFTHERYGIPSMFRGNERTERDRGVYCSSLFQREAIRFIHEEQELPWFLYAAFNNPAGSANLSKPGCVAPPEFLAKYPDRDPQDKRTRYMASVTAMDHAIGRIMNTIRELQLERDTLVFFFPDNGGGVTRPLRGGFNRMSEGGLRVPAVAYWPDKLPPGRTCDEFLSSLDVFPTLLAAGNVPPPADVALDGFNVLPTLQGRSPSPRNQMFWHQLYRTDNRAARVGQYKWFQAGDDGGLYDVVNDPGETHDLSDDRPELLAGIKTQWAAWRKEMDDCEWRGPFRED